jgi:hypothetical protein
MPTERATINQAVQVGVEVTPGTAVPANKRLQALGVEPSPDLAFQLFRPMGAKLNTLAQLGRDFVGASLSGRATYNEIVYPLSSVLKSATPTTPVGGTNSREWLFEPATYAVDVPKTFTVEYGDGRASRFTHGIIPEFGINFTRDEITLSGSMLGRAIELGITLTASPTMLDAVPIHPDDVSIYLDPTSGALGTTKLLRALSASFNISNRYGALWVLDRSQTSFVATVELEPVFTIGVTVEADSQGEEILSAMARGGLTRFMRIEAIGSIIEAALANQLNIDAAVKVSEVGDYSDEDGVYAIAYTFTIVHDQGWGKGLSVLSRNTVTAL